MPVSPRMTLRAPVIPERQVQRAILAGLRLRFPEALVHHSPNAASDARHRFHMAKDGVLPGYPDLTVLLPHGRTLLLEVKTTKGRLSPAQRDIHDRLAAMGHAVAVVRSVDEALAAVDAMLAPASRPAPEGRRP